MPEVGGHYPEHHHEFGDDLVGGQPQSCGGGIQHIVLLGAQVIVHCPVVLIQVGLVNYFVISRDIVGSGDDLIQPYRLSGQRVPPIEGGQAGGRVVADAREIIADLLAGHDLGIACFLNRNIGV